MRIILDYLDGNHASKNRVEILKIVIKTLPIKDFIEQNYSSKMKEK